MKLQNKIALVTGAERNIGKALAIGLAKEGANVVVNYYNSEESAQEVVSEIKKLGIDCIKVYADLSNMDDVQALFEKLIQHFGSIDILVNNAAFIPYKPFLDSTIELFDKTYQTNVKGLFYLTQLSIRKMIEQKSGKVLNIASLGATMGMRYNSLYCASKGAVLALTRELAIELGNHNIQVNAISPGVIHTHSNAELLNHPIIGEAYRESIPVGRVGKPKDLVGAAVFLASSESDYITGHNLCIDGGWSAQVREPNYHSDVLVRE